MKKILAASLIGAAVLLTGCASVPMASINADTKAKEFTPPSGKAGLYIYRNEIFGSEIPLSVAVNGRNLGQTGPQTYFHLNVSPGKYEVNSSAGNVSLISLIVEAGKNYFIWQEVKLGMSFVRTQLQQVDDASGKKGVMESKMATAVLNDADLNPLVTTVNGIATDTSVAAKLRDLHALRKDGVISEAEYQSKKAELLGKM